MDQKLQKEQLPEQPHLLLGGHRSTAGKDIAVTGHTGRDGRGEGHLLDLQLVGDGRQESVRSVHAALDSDGEFGKLVLAC